MNSLIVRIIANAGALWVASLLVAGIHIGGASTTSTIITTVLVALVFGLVNALIRPVVSFFSMPLLIVTLGLFTFIINALMLQVTEWIAGPLGLAFTIDRFWWDAVVGAVIVSLVSWFLSLVLPDGGE